MTMSDKIYIIVISSIISAVFSIIVNGFLLPYIRNWRKWFELRKIIKNDLYEFACCLQNSILKGIHQDSQYQKHLLDNRQFIKDEQMKQDYSFMCQIVRFIHTYNDDNQKQELLEKLLKIVDRYRNIENK